MLNEPLLAQHIENLMMLVSLRNLILLFQQMIKIMIGLLFLKRTIMKQK